MTMYDYDELKTKALAPDATKEDRIALFEWCCVYLGDTDWNGEYYDLGDGYRLFPVYDMSDEDAVQFDVIDAEIR